ncbi:MAG: serine protease [Leptospiraceae bacterium]|nr:MAG: serine protease [Leptospiraceae bacterium]
MKFIFLFILFDFFNFKKTPTIQEIKSSVVNIEVNSFRYSYEKPWNQPNITKAGGTGFIIELNQKKYILTNAHVVSGSFQIRVRRSGQGKYFFAKIKHIAHDCDLALLDIDESLNPKDEFYKDALPLEIGDTPQLNTPVLVIGFPIGGEKVSITQGIVSRIDMDTYSHSGVDSHLVIQVDAAINPGNSGGPAIQNGRVIGVAFQILRSGENLGYLIPPPVIKKFIKDISLDQEYDGYIELGVIDQTTENPMMKKALHLPDEYKNYGVFVYDILPDSSAEGYIKKGDVLLEIQNYKITDQGEVFINGEYRNYVEVIDNLEKGENIKVKVFRNGKILTLDFPAKITKFLDFQRKNYDEPPEYILYGGLVFQPLTSDLMSTYSSIWLSKNRSDIIFYYYFAVQNKINLYNKQIIILTQVLTNNHNQYAKEFKHRILESINGIEIKNMHHLLSILEQELKSKKEIQFYFKGEKIPLIFTSDELQNMHKEIITNYSIQKDHYLGNKYEK